MPLVIIYFVSYKLTNNTTGSNLMGQQHITEISIMQMLHKFFSDDMFSWCSWLLQSLDLTPLDFYLWGCYEENVYKNNPYTLPELRHNILLCISIISEQILHQTASNISQWVNGYTTEHGHLQYFTQRVFRFYVPFLNKHVSKQWVIQHGPKPGSWKTMIYSLGLEFGGKWLHFMPLNAGKGAEVF